MQIVVILLTSEPNENSFFISYFFLISYGNIPAFSARTSNAASVGDPRALLTAFSLISFNLTLMSSNSSLALLLTTIESRNFKKVLLSFKSIGAPFLKIKPSESYPDPVTSYSCSFIQNFSTVISFFVIVPVLSEAITDTRPSDSIADKFFMITPL